MKKVLITGAAGTIGKNVLKYLLTEGKYDVIALDLKTILNKRYLKKYKNRVDVVYGDVNDRALMDTILKDVDYVVHLAGVMPPLADFNQSLVHEIDYKGTENIIRILNFYNPKCHLFYPSTTSIYGKTDQATVKSECNVCKSNYYAKMKLSCEDLIKKKIKNYTIFRLPIVLCNPVTENFVFTYPRKENIEVISDRDAAYMFVRAIENVDKLNRKTYNVGGGKYSRISSDELDNRMLKTYGINNNFVKSKLFLDKTFYSPVLKDSDKLDKMIIYRNDSISSFFMRSKRSIKGRKFKKLIGKIFIREEK